MSGRIQLRCPDCSKTTEQDRQPGDPVDAMEAVIICPDCDDGDRHELRFFSASGREVGIDSGFGA